MLGFIQEIISRLFQAHCRRPVPLHSAPKHTFSKKKQGCVCVFVFYCICVFLFVCCVCVRRTSVQQQSRVCEAKRRLGCVDINGFTMECVKAWELVAAQLHSTVGTVGALLYQQEAVYCSKKYRSTASSTASTSRTASSAVQQALSPNCIALHCKLLYHDNGAKHQRKELPTPASTSTLLLSTQYLQV